MQERNLYKELITAIDAIKVFDTHEHLTYESEWKEQDTDFYDIFLVYIGGDLLSAGMEQSDLNKLLDNKISLKDKWETFSSVWDLAKNTNYSRSALIMLKDLFSADKVNYETTVKVSQKLKEEKNGSYFNKVLKDKANIEYIVNDLDLVVDMTGIKQLKPDYDYFLPVLRIDKPLMINSETALLELQKNGANIYCFDDYISFIDGSIQERLDDIYGIKIGLAYIRDLEFKETSKSQAEESFKEIYKSPKYNLHNWLGSEHIGLDKLKPFQDYMVHHIIKRAVEYGLPIQVHTGILAGAPNDITNADPRKLVNLILKYKKARFDLFHTGYPYSDELLCMVKSLPNCYFNFCWMSYISRTLYKNILDLAIELIPSSKIFGFGGDSRYVEASYASLSVARKSVAEVLYKKISEGYFTFDDAVTFAERILSKNPKALYLRK